MAFNELTGDALRAFDASRSTTAMPTIGTGPSPTTDSSPKRKLQGLFDNPGGLFQPATMPTGLSAASGGYADLNQRKPAGTSTPPGPLSYKDPYSASPILNPGTKNGDMVTNNASLVGSPNQTAPSNVWWNANYHEGGANGRWEAVGGADNPGALLTGNPVPATQHGVGSPDFNQNGPNYTAAGGSTYQAPTTPVAVPTVAAPDPNNPYTPGTDAYKARIASMTQGVDDAFLGAEQGLTDSMAGQGHISSGAEALLSAQHARALGDARNDMLANDPLRSLEYVNKGLGNTMTSDQIARYGAETPMYIQGLELANAGKTLSNQGASLDIQKTSALLPYEISAAQTGDAKAKADLDSFVQQMPYHLQQLQSQGALTKAQADQATWLQQNQGWLAALSFISNIIGGGGKIAGEALGLGLAPSSAFGAG